MPADPHTIVLRCSSLGKEKEKDYILSSLDVAVTKAWFEAIKAAQESVRAHPLVFLTSFFCFVLEDVSIGMAAKEQAPSVVPPSELYSVQLLARAGALN